jgi:hypothetical protein
MDFVFVHTVIDEAHGSRIECVGGLQHDYLLGGGKLQLLTSDVVWPVGHEILSTWNETRVLVPAESWHALTEAARVGWHATTNGSGVASAELTLEY